MTAAPQTAPLHFDTIDEAIDALRKDGRRLSTARRLVLEALFAADRPVPAQELSDTLEVDVTSVYRNLEMLERFGVVRHVHLGHGPGLYVLVGRREFEYLYCERCATVTPVEVHDLDAIRDEIETRFGLTARFTHFAIVGLCDRCASRRESRKRRASRGPHNDRSQ